MLRHNVARAVRFLRRQSGWRQSDLAARAGTSRELVSRLERGLVDGVTFGMVDRVASALGASVSVDLRWRGEQLDRLMDAAHAAMQGHAVQLLRGFGWQSEVEVSFNWYGDRGRYDALAYHAETRTLLAVEVKVGIGNVQETLGRLDVKTRLAQQAARQLGWPRPDRVVPCLVIADGSTARRIVARHGQLFSRFSLRGRAAHRWLADPTPRVVTGILLFEKLPDSHASTAKRLVRRPKDAATRST